MDELDRDLLLSPDFVPCIRLETRYSPAGAEILMKAYYKVLTVGDNITVHTERISPKVVPTDRY